MSSNAELQARRVAAVARGVATANPVFAVRAEGSELWDEDGKRYIDFAGGIAVLNTGHRHPKVIAAVKKQLDAFTHTAFQIVPYEPYIEVCERLNQMAPISGPKKSLLFSTGAEAVENAVKIARAHTGRTNVIAFSGSFHGRTLMASALTGKVAPYKKKFGPMPAGVWHAPFPVPQFGISVADSLRAIEYLFRADVDPVNVAAFILEPVQGEGGFVPAPEGFMKKIREICDENGIVMIADEVQTGFARTGKLFAMEHHGVAADITTMAKGLGGGLPISAVTGRAEIMDHAQPGGLGGTYAGNPLSVAAANAVLDVIEEEGLCDRAARLGARLKQRLASLQDQVPELVEIRGPGFMNAAEFNVAGTDTPNPDFVKKVCDEALERGLVLLTCGVYGNVIRFLSPLTIQEPVFEEALDILEASILAVKKG